MATSFDTPGSLSCRIPEYLDFRKSQGIAPGTLRNDAGTLRALLNVVGNILLRNVSDVHITVFLAERAKTRGAASLQIDHQVLNGFFEWARRTKKVPADHDPMAMRRAPKAFRKERRRVPASQFPELLDAAEHPRDRICVALGLYLFLRQSEVAALRVGHMGLQAGEMLVTVQKSKLEDVMPICSELEEELRQWMVYYTARIAGRPEADFYLVPGRTAAHFARDPKTGLFTSQRVEEELIVPTKPTRQPERIAQRALRKIGFLEGKSGQGEGIHTLRRSGARALFDSLVEEQDSTAGDPIRLVQSMLHHASQSTTERYIGVTPDRRRRDQRLRGRVMFNVNRSNVIKLGSAHAAHV